MFIYVYLLYLDNWID